MADNADGQILEFASKIDNARNFDECFDLLTETAKSMGFDGVLYTYTPLLFTDKNVDFQPIMRVSDNYGLDYLEHYQKNNYAQYDHMIEAAINGEDRIVDWFYEAYNLPLEGKSLEVLETAQRFGIRNGLSFPTLLSKEAFAGASFICRRDDDYFKTICVPKAQLLRVLTQLFHHKVIAEQHYQEVFIVPFLRKLSKTKLRVLQALANGENVKKIAANLSNDAKYTQNLIGEIRKDFGNVPRDRLLYLAGTINIDSIDT